jgi:hypothetical protein
MSGLRDFMRRLAVGFTYGLGFAIAFGAVTWAYTIFMSGREQLSASNIALVEHHRVPGSAAIVGTLKNTGSKELSFVIVRADLRDGDGRMLDQCMGHVAGAIEAGAERGFKVACSRATPAEFASYALHVSGR